LAIIDRLIIWSLCTVMAVTAQADWVAGGVGAAMPRSVSAVTAMLAATTVGGLNGYVRTKSFRAVTTVLFVTISAVNASFCTFLPFVLYDAFTLQPGLRHAVGGAAVAISFARLPVGDALLILGLLAAAWALHARTLETERVQAQLRQLRDYDREITLALTEKNKALMDKQDYEVRLAMLNERSRIAREIHDHVGHLLSRSILQVGALMVTVPTDEAKQGLSVMRDTLTQAMNSIRASVHDLHDESVDLRMQLETIVRDFSFCQVRLDYRVETQPPRDITYCFIAVVREGLSNVMRHSNATEVTVSVIEHPALYQLLVEDNGTAGSGVDMTAEGLGLRSMEDRVTALNGRFLVERRVGFRLFASVPKGGQNHESAYRG
jgi:signal transduction histidine kinase